MIKKISLIVLTLTLLTSCVSKKIFTDLEDKYSNLKKENRSLSDELGELTYSNKKLENECNSILGDLMLKADASLGVNNVDDENTDDEDNPDKFLDVGHHQRHQAQ